MAAGRNNLVGILLLLAGMALFGSATPVSKLVGEDLPVFTASLFRVVLGALALLPFVLGTFRANFRSLTRRDWGYLWLITLFGMVGFTVFLLYGMKFVSGVAGSIVMSFTPALTALAAFLLMGSPMDWRRSVAVGLGVAGVLVINVFKGQFGADDARYFYLGVGLVLAAIICEACYTLIGKKATENLPPLFTSFMASAMSVPAFLLLALIDYGAADLSALSMTSWGALLWWGVGTLGAGSALWYAGVSRTEGTTAAGFMAVMPLSALLLSYLLLGEPFRTIHLLGIGLVLASVAIMSWVHVGSMKPGSDEKESREARLLSACHCPGMLPDSTDPQK